MNRSSSFKFVSMSAFTFVAAMIACGCSTAPKSESGREDLRLAAEATIKRMTLTDPWLNNLLTKSAGYVVFPTVGKGGLIVGGAYGRGEVYEGGQFIGYADLSQATVGAQIGGQSFAELILFENKAAIDTFKQGKLAFSANASAVAMKAGAAESARYTDGVLVFVMPEGGLMLEASIGGQSFSFQPK